MPDEQRTEGWDVLVPRTHAPGAEAGTMETAPSSASALLASREEDVSLKSKLASVPPITRPFHGGRVSSRSSSQPRLAGCWLQSPAQAGVGANAPSALGTESPAAS